jgi:hypothetical protein
MIIMVDITYLKMTEIIVKGGGRVSDSNKNNNIDKVSITTLHGAKTLPCQVYSVTI